ncbi:MAG: hypothetical protein QOD10_5996 [Mycobacterium sp.]|nr:hypothetical protein [Mycobacterium sp.]
MSNARICVATAVLAFAATAGCSSDNNASPSSSASSASSTSAAASTTSNAAQASPALGQQGDYSAALIKASDIGPDFTAYAPPSQNPGGFPGVGQSFNNPDGSRVVIDGIVVYADPASTEQALAAHNFPKVNAPTPQPFEVGSNGRIATGMSPDNQKAVAEVVFSEGRATVNLIFSNAPDSPPAPDFVLDVARKQDLAVKNGLPS